MSCSPPAIRRRRPGGSTAPVRAHVGTAEDFLHRHRANVANDILRNGIVGNAILADLLHRVADDRNLRLAVTKVNDGGPGAGVDGVSPHELDHKANMQMADSIRDAMLAGAYRPGKERPVQIPKYSGGYRTLSIPNVADRVGQRAILQIVDPITDPFLEPGTVGGREGKSQFHALAMAEAQVRQDNHFLVVADVRKAFDVVPHNELIAVIRARLGKTPLTRIITKNIRANRKVGVGQGGPLSPWLLNVLLDEVLDKPFRTLHPKLRLIRYLDDLLVACPDRQTADRALTDLRTLLYEAKMPLKEDPAAAVVDLAFGETTRWLGFELSSRQSGLEVRIDERAWECLRQHLIDAHQADHPTTHANQVILGWVYYFGPCLPHTDLPAAYRRIAEAAETQGFEEIPTEDAVKADWGKAYARHRGIRTQYVAEDAPVPAFTNMEEAQQQAAAPPAAKNATTVPIEEEKVILPSSNNENPVAATKVTPRVVSTIVQYRIELITQEECSFDLGLGPIIMAIFANRNAEQAARPPPAAIERNY